MWPCHAPTGRGTGGGHVERTKPTIEWRRKDGLCCSQSRRMTPRVGRSRHVGLVSCCGFLCSGNCRPGRVCHRTRRLRRIDEPCLEASPSGMPGAFNGVLLDSSIDSCSWVEPDATLNHTSARFQWRKKFRLLVLTNSADWGSPRRLRSIVRLVACRRTPTRCRRSSECIQRVLRWDPGSSHCGVAEAAHSCRRRPVHTLRARRWAEDAGKATDGRGTKGVGSSDGGMGWRK